MVSRLGRQPDDVVVDARDDLDTVDLIDEPVELPHDLLRPADREGRHEQHAIRLGDEADCLGQDPDGLFVRFVFAATVRGLDENVVRGREDPRM